MKNNNTLSLEQKIDAAIEYGKSLVGAPHKWCILEPGMRSISHDGPPFYCDAKEYSPHKIKKYGTNCAGLLNLISRKIGVKPKGGIIMWTGSHISNLEMFNVEKIDTYPKGTLLFREYKSTVDQGYVAMVIGNGEMLHAYPNSPEPTTELVGPGVSVDSITESLSWIPESYPFFEYVLRPENWIES